MASSGATAHLTLGARDALVQITGDLDLAARPRLQAASDAASELRDHVKLDLSGVNFADSTGVSWLIADMTSRDQLDRPETIPGYAYGTAPPSPLTLEALSRLEAAAGLTPEDEW